MTTSKQPPQQRWMTTQPVPDFIPDGVTPACREVDPELFFSVAEKYDATVRAICHRCPLERACGEWAIDSGQRDGLWGGLDPAERKSLRRKMELAS